MPFLNFHAELEGWGEGMAMFTKAFESLIPVVEGGDASAVDRYSSKRGRIIYSRSLWVFFPSPFFPNDFSLSPEVGINICHKTPLQMIYESRRLKYFSFMPSSTSKCIEIRVFSFARILQTQACGRYLSGLGEGTAHV